MGEHIIMCCGARVRIVDDNIEVLDEPRVGCCPLMRKLYAIEKIDRKIVEKLVRLKIDKFGICTANRVFDAELWVPYGASEMIKICMKQGLFDASVIVCDGAGTVIVSNADLVQAIGARLTGIVKTSPIREIINYISQNGGVLLDEKSAKIDQVSGVLKAIELGYRKIAVTVAGFNASQIPQIRDLEREYEVEVAIFSVCNTCVTESDIKYLEQADLVWASASKIIREKIGKKAVIQLGVGIPVFVLTRKGKEAVFTYLTSFKDQLVIFRRKLPYIVEEKTPKLRTDI